MYHGVIIIRANAKGDTGTYVFSITLLETVWHTRFQSGFIVHSLFFFLVFMHYR